MTIYTAILQNETHSMMNDTQRVVYRTTCKISDAKTVILLLCFGLVFLVGLFGNITILSVFVPRIKRRSQIELLIVYLGVCDLFASIFGPGVFIYWKVTCGQRWDFGKVGCKIIPSMSRITVDISIGVVLIMAIERCRTIVTPFKERLSPRQIHVSVAFCLLSCILCEFYYIYAIEVTREGKCGVPQVSKFEYSVPLVVMTTIRDLAFVAIFSLTTVLVINTLKQSSTKLLMGAFSKKRQENNVKIMRMLVAMAIIFGILVIPRDILHLTFTISWMDWPRRRGIRPT